MTTGETLSKKEHSPGAVLREAREQSGMSIQDVAHELRLSSFQVQSLEDDFYEDLPGMTYVRGYLRGYARLLKIDEDKVLPPTEIVESESVSTDSGSFAPVAPRQARSSDRHMRVATIVVLFAIVGGLVAWWQSRSGGLQQAISLGTKQTQNDELGQNVTSVEQPGTMPAEETQVAILPVPVTEPELAANQDGPTPDEEPVAESPTESNANSEAVSLKPVPPPVQEPRVKPEAEDTLALAPKPTLKSAAESTSASNPAPTSKVKPKVQRSSAPAMVSAPKPASSTSDSKHIVLSFDGTSWVDVRDATDQRLLYQSVTQGRTLTVEGKPPFRVFLGNAKVVRMRYAGRPVDVAAYQTGLYARFVLGDTQ